MVNKRNHPQMALIQVSELLQFSQITWFRELYDAASAPVV